MKSSLFALLILIGFQSIMSCKSDDISPTSPNKTEGRLIIPKLGSIISTPKPITSPPNSTSRDSLEDEGQPIGDIVSTGLPSNNLTQCYPWVNHKDIDGYYGITMVIPMPKMQVK